MKIVLPKEAPEHDRIEAFTRSIVADATNKHAAAIALYDWGLRALAATYGDDAPGIVRASADRMELIINKAAGSA